MLSEIDFIRSKIVGRGDELSRIIENWKSQNKKIVFTNGCFDIIHRGHIEYLAKAATLGDYLVIGLNSDTSVKRLKGKGRPVMDEQSRALVLASLQFVEKVVIFSEDTPYDLIHFIQPHVLVKGGDYKPSEIVGYDIVMHNGGKVVPIEFVKGYSTTSIIEKLKKQF